MADPSAVPPGLAMPGRLRQRAVSVGLVPAARSSAVALAKAPHSGRAQPRGAGHRRGAAPRQRRRGASASAPRTQAPVNATWNDNTHTAGVFDASLRRPASTMQRSLYMLSEASTMQRPSLGITATSSIRDGGATGSVANVSLHSTPRSTPHRSPHRTWAALRQHLEPSTRLDLSASGLSQSGAWNAARPEVEVESSADGLDVPRSSPGSLHRMPIQEPCAVSFAPGPVQLDVVHIQRAREAPCSGHLSIVLPDGTSLGSAEAIETSAGHETVVIMPGGPAMATPSRCEVIEQPLKLEAPTIRHDKVKSVSERLSMLLRPQVSPSRPTQPGSCPVAPLNQGNNLLRKNQAFVLSQADVFVDAVLSHVLADTASALDWIPTGETYQTPPKEVERKTKDVVVEGGSLLGSAAQIAAEQLHDLELTLARRYAGQPACTGATTDAIKPQQHHSLLQHQATSSRLVVERPRSVRSRTTTGEQPFVTSMTERRQRAALPLERVREIEKYRTRFAHHCLASREAGIDRSHPGDATCVATWTIWPHLADAIALAAVESAIEEVHEALESHVDELVRKEVAGLHAGV